MTYYNVTVTTPSGESYRRTLRGDGQLSSHLSDPYITTVVDYSRTFSTSNPTDER